MLFDRNIFLIQTLAYLVILFQIRWPIINCYQRTIVTYHWRQNLSPEQVCGSQCRLLRVRRGAFGFLCHRGSFSFGRCTERTDLFVAPEMNRASSMVYYAMVDQEVFLYFWNKLNGLRFETRHVEPRVNSCLVKLNSARFQISGFSRYQEWDIIKRTGLSFQPG